MTISKLLGLSLVAALCILQGSVALAKDGPTNGGGFDKKLKRSLSVATSAVTKDGPTNGGGGPVSPPR